MSDCTSSGYWTDKACKELEKKCPKGGKHKTKEIQKDWQQCVKCKEDFYFK